MAQNLPAPWLDHGPQLTTRTLYLEGPRDDLHEMAEEHLRGLAEAFDLGSLSHHWDGGIYSEPFIGETWKVSVDVSDEMADAIDEDA